MDKDTIKAINALFNLPAKGDEQDWDIEMADKNRIEEFISAIYTYDLNSSQKYAVVCLILGSYDDYLESGIDKDNKIWLKIVNILKENREAYNSILNYWALWHDEKQDYWFNITSLIREYLKEPLQD